MSAGIPVKLLSEAQGHVVSLELNSGETYRGKLVECKLELIMPLSTASY